MLQFKTCYEKKILLTIYFNCILKPVSIKHCMEPLKHNVVTSILLVRFPIGYYFN